VGGVDKVLAARKAEWLRRQAENAEKTQRALRLAMYARRNG
jgi:hypothetical protein